MNRIKRALLGAETRRFNAELAELMPEELTSAARQCVMHEGTGPLEDRHRDRFPNGPFLTVNEADTLDFAIELKRRSGKTPAVLNMACAYTPGSGWRSGALSQEETLFYRSTYDLSMSDPLGLNPERTWRYPIPPTGAIYSPGVLVYRSSLNEGCQRLKRKHQETLSFVAVAAVRNPALNADGQMTERDVALTCEKIRTVLRVSALHGHDTVVLGALGCGAYHNPPEQVAQSFCAVFGEPEFRGVFEHLAFAILDGPDTSNRRTFERVLLAAPSHSAAK